MPVAMISRKSKKVKPASATAHDAVAKTHNTSGTGHQSGTANEMARQFAMQLMGARNPGPLQRSRKANTASARKGEVKLPHRKAIQKRAGKPTGKMTRTGGNKDHYPNLREGR